jgi:NifU-like protein involved in Fe-S cluster formation
MNPKQSPTDHNKNPQNEISSINRYPADVRSEIFCQGETLSIYIKVDPAYHLILDCKWSALANSTFRPALSILSESVVGLTLKATRQLNIDELASLLPELEAAKSKLTTCLTLFDFDVPEHSRQII